MAAILAFIFLICFFVGNWSIQLFHSFLCGLDDDESLFVGHRHPVPNFIIGPPASLTYIILKHAVVDTRTFDHLDVRAFAVIDIVPTALDEMLAGLPAADTYDLPTVLPNIAFLKFQPLAQSGKFPYCLNQERRFLNMMLIQQLVILFPTFRRIESMLLDLDLCIPVILGFFSHCFPFWWRR